ncbi:MAG: flagellar motor protein MotB [Oligoflexus sp.]|nr:flagellar motor protein MotB [Oligoflexus sp.]
MKRHHQHHEEAEDGEGWLISYADLMTLMFGFFVLMYKAVSSDTRVEDLEKKIGASLVGFERPVMEHIEKVAPEDRQARAFQLLLKMVELDPKTSVGEIEKKYADQTEAKALKEVFGKKFGEKGTQDFSLRVENNLRIVIPTDTGFASGESTLLPTAGPKLQDIIATLSKLDDLVKIEVIGHTDDIPPKRTGAWVSNWSLSAARAATVGNFMQEHGIDSSKIKISGAADTSPLVPIKGLDGEALANARKQNRRLELVIVRQAPKATRAQP